MLNNGFSFLSIYSPGKKKGKSKYRYFGFKKAHRFKLFFSERFCIYNENHQKQGWK